eukprot:TRINITY_DN7362_c0_g3_i1.p1 TRINITY_DN7362_c0_g3~~TRINITY_DN7362_c0_g3_i1.p1  ORF type:complete len:275 (-),score=27.98 TRINITY_DN7362_c0_g3_i1:510-1289(-)
MNAAFRVLAISVTIVYAYFCLRAVLYLPELLDYIFPRDADDDENVLKSVAGNAIGLSFPVNQTLLAQRNMSVIAAATVKLHLFFTGVMTHAVGTAFVVASRNRPTSYLLLTAGHNTSDKYPPLAHILGTSWGFLWSCGFLVVLGALGNLFKLLPQQWQLQIFHRCPLLQKGGHVIIVVMMLGVLALMPAFFTNNVARLHTVHGYPFADPTNLLECTPWEPSQRRNTSNLNWLGNRCLRDNSISHMPNRAWGLWGSHAAC